MRQVQGDRRGRALAADAAGAGEALARDGRARHAPCLLCPRGGGLHRAAHRARGRRRHRDGLRPVGGAARAHLRRAGVRRGHRHRHDNRRRAAVFARGQAARGGAGRAEPAAALRRRRDLAHRLLQRAVRGAALGAHPRAAGRHAPRAVRAGGRGRAGAAPARDHGQHDHALHPLCHRAGAAGRGPVLHGAGLWRRVRRAHPRLCRRAVLRARLRLGLHRRGHHVQRAGQRHRKPGGQLPARGCGHQRRDGAQRRRAAALLLHGGRPRVRGRGHLLRRQRVARRGRFGAL